MKVNNFLILYNTRVKNINEITKDIILQTISDLIKPVEYISYDDKLKLISDVLEKSSASKYPTAERNRDFLIALISRYTSLEMDKNGFDLLCETKLLDYVLATFQSECEFITRLLNMCLQDESR